MTRRRARRQREPPQWEIKELYELDQGPNIGLGQLRSRFPEGVRQEIMPSASSWQSRKC